MLLSDGVSVIVPTYNRSELLMLSLKSLEFQTFDKDKYEVIVIDDGSIDGTKEVVDSFRTSMNINYLYQEHHGFRVARARNLGVFSAKFTVCIFLDSGMLASPDLLAVHFKAHMEYRNPIAYVGYAYGFDEFNETYFLNKAQFHNKEELSQIFKSTSGRSEYKDCRERGLQQLGLGFNEISIPWLLFWTCHASCSTASLITINGFDENFQTWGGEDVELAIRLHKNKVKIAHLPHALAIHLPHHRSSETNKASSYQNCQYIYKKHPSVATKLLAERNQSWEIVISRLCCKLEELS